MQVGILDARLKKMLMVYGLHDAVEQRHDRFLDDAELAQHLVFRDP